MGFWPTQRILARHQAEWLIADANHNALDLAAPDAVKEAAYTLRLGPEVYVTSSASREKRLLGAGEQVAIPPGQFAMLLTEEVVRVPRDALAFISIKAGIKFRGLVNVSGFHVDPGFEGRLMFSVFNAGSEPICLARGDRLFPIWFSDLVDDTGKRQADDFGYPPRGRHALQAQISSADVMNLQGHIASPGSLKVELDKLRNTVSTHRAIGVVVATALVPIYLAFIPVFIDFIKSKKADPQPVTCIVPASPTQPAAAPAPTGEPTSAPPAKRLPDPQQANPPNPNTGK
ncbi:hypothetical protein [Anaeromyxobacter sp. PSR-1]|uniref:dCTP deaminase domain-containing protein n=1 Tax=Anaeromyxobacter sp. PSR-1 TaxID=1300915 RepID=UPI001269DDD9|nr:hypothetical protein [Anaeromyxobacter sp. PSR-1]